MQRLTAKVLEDFDLYIHAITVNIKKELDLSPNKLKKEYTSKKQEQAHLFYNSLKTHLEKEIYERKELLNPSTVKKKSFTKRAIMAGTTGIAGTATVTSGLAYLPKNTNFVAQNNVAPSSNEMTKTVPGVETATNNIGENETGEHFLGNIGETAVIVGSGVVTVSGIILLGTAASTIKKCVHTRIKKHESEYISKYLKNNHHMIELITVLLTSCIVEKSINNKELHEFDMKRITKKESSLLIKNLAKLEKNKKKECPHLIADELLRDFSFSEEYSLKEKELLLRQWLGALEQTINKSKHLIDLNLFLKKLDALRDMTQQDISALKNNPSPTSNNRITFFSSPEHYENNYEKNISAVRTRLLKRN